MCDILIISNLCLALYSISNIFVERLRFTKIFSLLFTFILIHSFLKLNGVIDLMNKEFNISEQNFVRKLFS